MKQIGDKLVDAVKQSRQGNVAEASQKFDEIKTKIQSEFSESLQVDAADVEEENEIENPLEEESKI